MPVKNVNGNGKVAAVQEKKSSGETECCSTHMDNCCGGKCCSHGHGFAKKIIVTLVAIVLVYLIVLLGTMIRNNIQKYYFIGKADRTERTIVVQGQGKVTIKPDIAKVSMGMMANGATVAEAQQKNTEVMNNLVTKLKTLGIESKDIQTNDYNIYPQYDYTQDKGQVLKGYQVTQSVTVKIRDLTKANQVLALAGEVGANNVSGLQFTVDDRENYKTEARNLALKQVIEKAKGLSQTLGVKMVGIVSYDEFENGTSFPMYKTMTDSFGMGGGAASPQIEAGTNEVILNVNVGFEIR